MDEKDFLFCDSIIDCDNPEVKDYAFSAVGDCRNDPVESAVRLYYAVRDPVLYDPYLISGRAEDYRASVTLNRRRGFCVQKAALLCALGRACHIPSRLGFATVKNHLATQRLIEFVGSNLFVFHGYTEFFLNGKWVKATPAFNETLCQRHRVAPLEFDGRSDSIFHAYNADQQLFMEYIEDFGTFSTVPMETMIETWRSVHGSEQVKRWFQHTENPGDAPRRDFHREKPLTG